MVELVLDLGNEIRKSSEWIDVKLSLLFHQNKTSLMDLGNFLFLLLALISCLIIFLADLPRVMEALKKADGFLEQTLVDKCKARFCKLLCNQ